MATRETTAVKGTVYDLPHIMSLSDDDCRVLAVSSRTLYFVQAFSRLEIKIRSRYSRETLAGGLYIIADDDDELNEINDLVNRYSLEVFDVTCDLVAAINGLQSVIQSNSCGCEIGQGSDTIDGEAGGPIPDPIGDIEYIEPDPIQDRKCKASNLIHETQLDLFSELNDFNVDDMAGLGLAVVIGIVSGIIATTVATPLAGIVVGVAGLVAAFVAQLLGVSVDLQDIVDKMTSEQEALVCALFTSTTASGARTAYNDVLSAAGLGSLEIALIEVLQTNALFDVLFFDTLGTAAFWPLYTGPVDCDIDCGCLDPAQPWVLNLGTGNIDLNSSILVSQQITPGDHRIRVNIPSGFTTDNKHIREVSLSSFIGYTPQGGSEAINFSDIQVVPDCLPFIALQQENPPVAPDIRTNGFYVQSTTTFTVFYEFVDV